jgi:hypothetical protein
MPGAKRYSSVKERQSLPSGYSTNVKKLKIETNNHCTTSVSVLDRSQGVNFGGLNSKGKLMLNLAKGSSTPIDLFNRS